MASPRDRPTNDVTELAKERTRQAIERTLLSWVNSALLLLGLGISLGAAAVDLKAPGGAGPEVGRVTLGLGLGIILFATGLLLSIAAVYRHQLRSLGQGRDPMRMSEHLNLAVVVAAVVAFGVAALVDVLLN